MSLFGFGGPSCKVEIELDNSAGVQKTIEVESEETKEELIIYSGADNIKGKVKVIIPSGKKLEHVGIKVELIGTIGTCFLPAAHPTLRLLVSPHLPFFFCSTRR